MSSSDTPVRRGGRPPKAAGKAPAARTRTAAAAVRVTPDALVSVPVPVAAHDEVLAAVTAERDQLAALLDQAERDRDTARKAYWDLAAVLARALPIAALVDLGVIPPHGAPPAPTAAA